MSEMFSNPIKHENRIENRIFDRIARREYTLLTLSTSFHHVGQRRPAGALAPGEDKD
jgi:hypothetical protein